MAASQTGSSALRSPPDDGDGEARPETAGRSEIRTRDEGVAGALRELLDGLGVPRGDVDERRLRSMAQALRTLTQGYEKGPGEVIGKALFDEAGDEPVMVRDIPFVSMCQEHLLPFHGSAAISYLPGESVVGLSKLARLLDLFAHRLQSPAQLAEEVAGAVECGLDAKGVAVRIHARFLCPGVSGTVTSEAYRGSFRLPLWRERLEALW